MQPISYYCQTMYMCWNLSQEEIDLEDKLYFNYKDGK